jgi:RND superfamily putative drug exporter
VGLAVAVLADAFLLRMTAIPALMHLIGRRNWAIPSWLDRVLPHVSVESASPAHPAGKHRTPVAVSVP